ncbi:hypothetical protein ACSBR2_027218 [Camellia fascicularis]
MDQPRTCSCCTTIVLLFTILIYSIPGYLVNAQPQTLKHYTMANLTSWINTSSSSEFRNGSFVFHPIANLYTSWINTPSSSEFRNGSFVFQPILLRGSFGTGYGCGFYCNYTYSDCLFAVVIHNLTVLGNDSISFKPQLVWSANRNRPVKLNATLQLTKDGDLILADSDGTSVWSTKTGGGNYSVSGLNLTEDGNLVLFDRNSAMVWQSFDNPTDSLVFGQKLVPGQKLTASISASNWSEGLYSLAVHSDGWFVYIESNPPQSYFGSSLGESPYVKFENGSINGNNVPPANTNTSQFMRLEPDGHLKVYEWGGYDWGVVVDLLTVHGGECQYPMACGEYGICSKGQCGCPGEANTETVTFRQINFMKPNLGCSIVTPISCDHSQYHSLLELKDTSYFNLNLGYYSDQTQLLQQTDVEGCKTSCLRNCSCKAAIFAYDLVLYNRKTGCLLLSEVFSLRNNEGGFDNVTVFLKVQKSPTQKKSKHATIILGSSLGAFFVVFFMVASCLYHFRNKGESEELDDFNVEQAPGMSTRFSYEDLRAMTSNFNNKLGEGGFGTVFEGTLKDGTKVAVKLLNGFGQVKKSFLAEVETIGSIHHVNLVRLIGFCAEKSYRLLVYEYMSNGSLDTWIFHRHQELTLGWQSRRKIIMDIAKGLTYLHEECRQKILHLDIKPQNILLDEYSNAKISDFGLSKLIDKDQSQIVTMMRGTLGYLAPEWLSSIITEKVDVYSFGVVVLEMLCGRKNLDRSQPEEDMHLLGLFKRKAEEERLLDIVDKYDDDMQTHRAEVVEMMRVAAWCLQSDFSRRPSMSVVVKVLEGSVDVESNLDYSFTTPVVPRAITVAGHQEDDIGAATPLFASALSGPR